jgi:hypothetical protein
VTEASYDGCGCAGGEVVTLTDEGTIVDGVTKYRRQKICSDPLGRQWKTEVLNWDGSVYSTTESTLNARDQVTLVRQFQGLDTSGVYQDTTIGFDGYGRLHGIVRLTAEDVIGLFLRHTPRMRTSVSLYHRHRFPAEIISHCVWLYFRFALSFRDVEEMLAMRGVALTYETVREWCLKFGQTYANGLRRKSPRPGDRWHLGSRSAAGSPSFGPKICSVNEPNWALEFCRLNHLCVFVNRTAYQCVVQLKLRY